MGTSKSAEGCQRIWKRCEPDQVRGLKIIPEQQAENQEWVFENSKQAGVVLRYQRRRYDFWERMERPFFWEAEWYRVSICSRL